VDLVGMQNSKGLNMRSEIGILRYASGHALPKVSKYRASCTHRGVWFHRIDLGQGPETLFTAGELRVGSCTEQP
jgi:hypothetical protein